MNADNGDVQDTKKRRLVMMSSVAVVLVALVIFVHIEGVDSRLIPPLPGYPELPRMSFKPVIGADTLQSFEQIIGPPFERSEDGRTCVWYNIQGRYYARARCWLYKIEITDVQIEYYIATLRATFDESGVLADWEGREQPGRFDTRTFGNGEVQWADAG